MPSDPRYPLMELLLWQLVICVNPACHYDTLRASVTAAEWQRRAAGLRAQIAGLLRMGKDA